MKLNPLLQCCKMVRHTLKILQHLLQDFLSVSDHFTALRSKGLNSFLWRVVSMLFFTLHESGFNLLSSSI